MQMVISTGKPVCVVPPDRGSMTGRQSSFMRGGFDDHFLIKRHRHRCRRDSSRMRD
jgi:hypothetical protein